MRCPDSQVAVESGANEILQVIEEQYDRVWDETKGDHSESRAIALEALKKVGEKAIEIRDSAAEG